MNRGDRREAIFADDQDRRCFLETLEEACQKTGWRGSSRSTSAPVSSWRPGSHTEEYGNLINRPLHRPLHRLLDITAGASGKAALARPHSKTWRHLGRAA